MSVTTTSFGSLSVRNPRNTGCRSRPSCVHSSVNLTWATSTGSSQWQRFMAAGVIPSPQRPRVFSGKLIKGQVDCLSFLELCIDARKEVFRKTDSDSAGEAKTIRAVVTGKQGAEIFATSFMHRVAADHKFLAQSQLNFDPGAAAPAAFVD
jgi:hypothetical protein